MNPEEALNHFKSLPYRRRVEPVQDPDDGRFYICSYPDLPGLAADGKTRAEAIKNAQQAFDDYILARAERGDLPAEPADSRRIKMALRRIVHQTTSFVFFEGRLPMRRGSLENVELDTSSEDDNRIQGLHETTPAHA